LESLYEQGAKNLTLISNNAGSGTNGIAKLVIAGRIKKMICSFPRQKEEWAFDDLYRAGKIELELVPQGTLAERIRAGGAGIGGFYTPTGFGTELANGKETRVIDGVNYIFEKAIKADYALIKADKGDRWGNLTIALDAQTLKVAFAWMALGLVVYFVYGRKHSNLNK
jgi:3-oxoadipate CoA-transferase alpha subunit